ncbi:BatA domain-containing protein [Rubinisphaera margarita]|uniref:BatA domain-containing protein n=1 Tax=Rubinisphaera margarita TaxID=2909586 RepID=UPI001EE79D97|nr:BatA domain-containing protein [Rubinisphaera margarita]MCG6156402.1 BatA domain-containing protein [Rubinisphaera margarita]
MSFLQPAMLWALPIIALPIVIHLINQRRYRTIEWAAMTFLLAATTMSRGYARIRQWLILAMRTLAIAGLVFAISRPLASGWLRLAAPGTVDTTIVLLDTSPSMQQQGNRAGVTKLDAARTQLMQSLKLIHSNHWIVIDSATLQPHEIESPEMLDSLVPTKSTSASADIPGMLQAAYEYLRDNRPSQTEIWICSDLRQNDWDAESARWKVLREAFLEAPTPTRFHLLAYGDGAAGNRSIRLTAAETRETMSGRELLISLVVRQSEAEKTTLPVRLEVAGGITEIPVELTGTETELVNYAIPLAGDPQKRGWGRLKIPADANSADNEFYFVFDEPPPRQTMIVAENDKGVRSLQLAAEIAPDVETVSAARVMTPQQAQTADWDQVALLLWQAELPDDSLRPLVESVVDRGGRVIFFPPEGNSADEFAGLGWGDWHEEPVGFQTVNWRQDQDLLANVRSGEALPVNELSITRYRTIEGEQSKLATLDSGDALLSCAITPRRNVYFCGTRATDDHSTLARNGIVLYAMIQRALADGAESLAAARQVVAGEVDADQSVHWQRLASDDAAVSTRFRFHAGAYEQNERLYAVNRSSDEDRPLIVDSERTAGLFQGLQFDRVDEQTGEDNALLREIWATFLFLMLLALIAEAALSIPRRRPSQANVTPAFVKEAAA